MSQQTFAEASCEQYRKPTRRERFLAEMEQVIPWSELAAVIEPYDPKAEGPASAGRSRANAPYPFPATLGQSV